MAQLVETLEGLPTTERREVLESLVVQEFKTALLMEEDEDIPLDGSFFELGLTSLRINDLKLALETLIGREISANVLFNSPTLNELLDYLTGTVMAELFSPAAVRQGEAPDLGGATTDDQRAVLDDLLDDLYRA